MRSPATGPRAAATGQRWQRRGRLLGRACECLFLAVLLFLAALSLPERLARAGDDLEALRRWRAPADQYRQAVGADLYDALQAANQALPGDAAVLLVTAGADIHHWEYAAYHRALYFLSPRQVWWAAGAERDGTWQSRWWRPVALSPAALETTAREVGAAYILALRVDPRLLPGRPAGAMPADGSLIALQGAEPRSAPAPAPAAGGLWLLALAIVIPMLGGRALIRLIGGRDHASAAANLIERGALSWLAGAGILSVALFWCGRFGLAPARQLALIAALTMMLCIWAEAKRPTRIAFARRHPAPSSAGQAAAERNHPAPEPPRSRLRLVMAMLIGVGLAWLALEIGMVALSGIGKPLAAWDSWVSWGMRARLIFLNAGIDDRLLTDGSRVVTNQHYPLLLPLTESWIYAWLGAPDDRFAAIPGFLAYLALLGLVFGAARERAPAGGALAVVLAFASLPYLARFAGIGYADVTLAAYLTGMAVMLRRWQTTGRRADLVLAVLLGGFLPWVKGEGALLLAATCGALLVAGPARWRVIGLLLASAALIAGPWYLWVAAYGAGDPAHHGLSWAGLGDDLGRLPAIMREFSLRARLPEWRGLWLLAAIGLVAGTLRAAVRRKPPRLYLTVAAIYLPLVMSTYLLSAYEPLAAHILNSADRLLLQAAPLVVLWLVEGCRHPTAFATKPTPPPTESRARRLARWRKNREI